MTIINAFKNSNLKAFVHKAALAGVIAAAAFMATPQKANAQVGIGIRFGHPGYVARVPVYQAPVYDTPVYGASTNYGYVVPTPYAYGYDHGRDWDRHDWDRRRFAERNFRGSGRR